MAGRSALAGRRPERIAMPRRKPTLLIVTVMSLTGGAIGLFAPVGVVKWLLQTEPADAGILTLFFLPRPQLLATLLEILRALCLRGRIDSRSETFDGDACIHAVRIRARRGRITVALHEHAIEQNAILHQIRHGHRGNAPRTAGAKQSHGGQAPAGDH